VRNPLAPDVPTFAELGFKGMTETPWLGMFCTPEVPAPVQARLHGALTALLAQPDVHKRWADLGMMVPSTPAPTQQELVKTLQSEHAAQGKRLAAIGFKPE
jgi:tripartite-type tricarboxylate transporter receptor subunit TctC